jgi:hypothetical protein
MAGIMISPMAATAAEPVPAIAAKNRDVTIVTMPNPPVNRPVNTLARSIRRLEIPPFPITSPANVNKGTAIRGKEFSPCIMDCTKVVMLIQSMVRMVVREASPRLTPIGMESSRNRINDTNNKIATISLYSPFSNSSAASFSASSRTSFTLGSKQIRLFS